MRVVRFVSVLSTLGLASALGGCPEALVEADAARAADAPVLDGGVASPDAITLRDAPVGPDTPSYVDAPGACLPSTPVSGSTALTGQTFAGASSRDFLDITCGGNDGPAVYYTVEVGPRQRLEATLQTETLFDNLIQIHGCDARYCEDLVDRDALHFTNPGTTPRSVLLAVSRAYATDTLPFDLNVQVLNTDPGLVCSDPIPVVSGARLTAQQNRFGADLGISGGCGFPADAAAFYSITVPAGQRLTAVVRGTRSLQLRVTDGCSGEAACLAYESARTPSVTYTNTSAADRAVILSIAPDLTNIVSVPFELDVDLAP